MTPASGPFAIAATLVAVGGAAKALRPGDTANALRALHVPAPTWLVRVGGAVEAVIGVAAVVRGDRVTAALVAASYLVFAVFIATARARHAPIATCGCFGKADTPPTLVHLLFDLGAFAAACAVAVQPGVGIGDVVAAQPLAGVPYLLLVATGTYVAFLVLTSLPRLLALVDEGRAAA